VYLPIVRAPWITIRDQLRPLLNQVWHGIPIAESIADLPDAWSFRYGPVFYLVAHPLAIVSRHHGEALYVLLLLFGHLCFWTSLFLIDRRFFRDSSPAIRLLVVGIALNFTPALAAMACACLDSWELLAITAAVFLATSSARWVRNLAGVSAMLGVLTKLMPVLVFVLVFVRNRAAGIIGLVAGAVVLTAAQALYGGPMGWGFPRRVIGVGRDQVQEAARWWENDSLRGIVYKALAGFALPAGRLQISLDPTTKAIVDATMTVGAIGVLIVTWMTLWRWTPVDAREPERNLGAFAVAIALLHLLSPYSTHQYWPATLLCFAFILRSAQRGLVRHGEGLAALAALVLIGNVAPQTVVAWLTGVGRLNDVLGSVPRFDRGQMYTFYAMPGLGLILLAIVVWRVQRRLVNAPPGDLVPIGHRSP
jgi:glycosyl transferase family 87